MTEQGGVMELEEGEAELLCYECGADFRSRHYFLKHIRAHKNAEMFGIAMTKIGRVWLIAMMKQSRRRKDKRGTMVGVKLGQSRFSLFL